MWTFWTTNVLKPGAVALQLNVKRMERRSSVRDRSLFIAAGGGGGFGAKQGEI